MSPIIRTSLIFLIGATLADACQVPVFRYALERWRNDPYQVFVVANGELEAGARKTFEQLRALEEDFKAPANIYAKKVDLAKEPLDSPLRKHVKDGKIDLPAILLYYPEERLKYPPIWTAPATQDRVKVLANSPVRREVLQRILKGDSAVWVMVESTRMGVSW